MTDRPAEINRRDPLSVLTLAALVIALGAVAARCTVMELSRSTGIDLGAAGDIDGGGPGVTTTLLLDVLCILPAFLVLMRRALDRAYVLRWNISHVLVLLLAAWITASGFWASNRFNAFVGAGTWWAAASLLWSTSQLVRSWTRLRPVLGVAVGLSFIFISQAVIYRYLELPGTQEAWKKQRAEMIARDGPAAADDFTIKRFDLMVANGPTQGFYRSPNTFAAIAVLCALITAGFGVQRLLEHDEPVFAGLMMVPVTLTPIILWWTSSRTAQGVAAMTAVALVVAWLGRGWLGRKSRTAYAVGVGVTLLVTAVVLAIGIKTGGLIHDSLNFRWNYWVASWHMVRARPWLGVGWTNFGNAYLPFRLPVMAEDIKDPHNLIVRFATETGLIGAALAIAWLARAFWEATRPIAPRVMPSPAATWKPLPTLVAVAVLFALLRTMVLWPLSILLLEGLKTLLFAVLLLAGLVLATVRNAKEPVADERPALFLIYATVVGLLGFLLHNGVDFAVSETGPLLVLMLVLGALLGVRHPSVAGQRTHTVAALCGLAAACAAGLCAAGFWGVPVAMAEAKAAAGDDAGVAGHPGDAVSLLREAEAASPVPNPDYPARELRWFTEGQADDILATLSRAIAADPAAVRGWLDRARFRTRIHSPASPTLSDYAAAVTRNPTDASIRLEYAAALDAAGNHAEAAEQYQLALANDDKLHADEPRRLSPERVAEIRKRIGLSSSP